MRGVFSFVAILIIASMGTVRCSSSNPTGAEGGNIEGSLSVREGAITVRIPPPPDVSAKAEKSAAGPADCITVTNEAGWLVKKVDLVRHATNGFLSAEFSLDAPYHYYFSATIWGSDGTLWASPRLLIYIDHGHYYDIRLELKRVPYDAMVNTWVTYDTTGSGEDYLRVR